jgi:hypothetical protein
MQVLQELAGQQRFLLVRDSKLISRGNVLAMNQAELRFVAPAGKSYVPAQLLSPLDREAAIPVEYLAERDLGKPPEERGSYRVLEGEVGTGARGPVRNTGLAAAADSLSRDRRPWGATYEQAGSGAGVATPAARWELGALTAQGLAAGRRSLLRRPGVATSARPGTYGPG